MSIELFATRSARAAGSEVQWRPRKLNSAARVVDDAFADRGRVDACGGLRSAEAARSAERRAIAAPELIERIAQHAAACILTLRALELELQCHLRAVSHNLNAHRPPPAGRVAPRPV
eukprot:2986386-Rhodomonas_salina.2